MTLNDNCRISNQKILGSLQSPAVTDHRHSLRRTPTWRLDRWRKCLRALARIARASIAHQS